MTETGRAGCCPPASDEGANDRRRSRTEYFRRYRQANRDKNAEYLRRYRQANRDKIAEQGRLYREANREKIAESKRLYHQANRDKIAERKRLYHQANRDKIAERTRLYYQANRDKIAERERLYHQANRDKIIRKTARYRKALMLARAGIPLLQKRGHLNNQWQGGRFVTCSFPECNRNAGWRCPYHFKNNKYGFLCSEHRHAYHTLKKLKEENNV